MFGASRTEKRLKELEETMLRLTRLVESHDLEWDDMRARCKRLLDRTEKAARRLEPDVESVSTEPQDGSVIRQDGHALTPRQMQIQQQILRRRAGMS